MRLFQYPCKKGGFEYLEYHCKNLKDETTISEPIQSPSRCFAKKDCSTIGTIYKHKESNGKHSVQKLQSVPENVLIWNGEILSDEAVKTLVDQIDYDFYVKRIYKRIKEFL